MLWQPREQSGVKAQANWNVEAWEDSLVEAVTLEWIWLPHSLV